ncbi:DUF2291 family protein [Vibrio sp. HA2012]|uniref:DUF2291 family protein n=1 Tax=Vibrio sp. HA2012 TaxID=1971595 RepID=UPI0012FE7CD7|nr:DUF2291 family protein [Vibrio sp. HA2012]
MISIEKIGKLSLISLFCLSLSACEVVDLDANGNPIIPMSAEEAASIKNMTPKALAEQFWGDVLTEAKQKSVNFDLLSLENNTSTFIKLRGKIIQVDTSSKNATMTVKALSQQITVQIGPIIRGNAIRDAASFLTFDQFKNQVQFARLSKELNKKAMTSFVRPDESWTDSDVDMIAAVTVKEQKISEVIPIEIIKR